MTATIGEEFVAAVWPDGAGIDRRHSPKASVTRDGVLEQRTLVDTSAATAWTGAVDAVAPTRQEPPIRVGDLFVRIPTADTRVVYVVEINATDNEGGASAVEEGGEKPEQTFEFEGAEDPVAKLAAVGRVTLELLADAAGLRDWVDRRLLDRVRVREEIEIFDGDGTGEYMLGLRSVSGVQSQAFATSVANTIATAIAKVENVHGRVDGIAIHPTAYRISQAAAASFWNDLRDEMRIVSTPSVGANAAVLGAFGTAAVIRERSTTVRFSDDHETDFVKNQVAILVERRELLAVNVPSWFADCALA